LQDFSEMKWRGCTIHAIHIGEYDRVHIPGDGTAATESDHMEFDDMDDSVPWNFLVLDIDYIVSRLEPEAPGREPAYWIAPATLRFGLASAIAVTISDGSPDPVLRPLGTTATDLAMSDVQRIRREGDPDSLWRITGEGFDIRLAATGFFLHLRAEPKPVNRPSLDLAERGGVSFADSSFA
jgi:hypothetical protein